MSETKSHLAGLTKTTYLINDYNYQVPLSTASLFPFPVILQAPIKHTTIVQSPNIQTALTQNLPQTNSTPIKDNPHTRLPKHIHPLIIVCVGNLIETPTHRLEKNIKKSFILKDICDNTIPNAHRSWRVHLSPESLALFIVNYLTSVSNGGLIMKELFETMLVYLKLGEQEWMQVSELMSYYKLSRKWLSIYMALRGCGFWAGSHKSVGSKLKIEKSKSFSGL